MGYPGTLTLRVETLIDLICDVCGSVGRHGFGKIAVLNGHGGNDGLLQAAAVKASVDGMRVATMSYWNLIPEAMSVNAPTDHGDVGRAGEMETSTQLVLQPDRVDLAAAPREQFVDLGNAVGPVPAGEGGRVYLPPDPESEAPSGVYGCAPVATAAKG
jgi:creatinine amidohydrolase